MTDLTDAHHADPQPSPGLIKARERGLRERRYLMSAKISATTRVVAVGYLLIYFAAMFQLPSASPFVEENGPWLVALAVSGFLAIALDYGQYMFSYLSTYDAEATETRQYPAHSAWRLLQSFAFWVKQLTAVIGGICLLYLFSQTL